MASLHQIKWENDVCKCAERDVSHRWAFQWMLLQFETYFFPRTPSLIPCDWKQVFFPPFITMVWWGETNESNEPTHLGAWCAVFLQAPYHPEVCPKGNCHAATLKSLLPSSCTRRQNDGDFSWGLQGGAGWLGMLFNSSSPPLWEQSGMLCCVLCLTLYFIPNSKHLPTPTGVYIGQHILASS